MDVSFPKGFRRTNERNLLQPRALYLHSVWDSPSAYYFYVKWKTSFVDLVSNHLIMNFDQVLTHRSGSAVMLSLIYSEILKMLRLWGLLNFDVEIFFPHDAHSLPRAYDKQKSKESDQPHIITTQMLLEEVSTVTQIELSNHCSLLFFFLFIKKLLKRGPLKCIVSCWMSSSLLILGLLRLIAQTF